MALGRAEKAGRGRRDRRSDVISKVFRSRTELRLKNEENNFELNAGGEGKPMKLLCNKKEMREKRGRRAMSRAEALRTVWMGDSRTLGRPMSRVTIINMITDNCIAVPCPGLACTYTYVGLSFGNGYNNMLMINYACILIGPIP